VIHAPERRIVVFLARDVEELSGVANAIREILEGANDSLERFAFLAELLRPLRIVPDVRIFGEPGDFAQTDLLLVEVKDTSATEPSDVRRPSAAWR
jgi:hypothetical protein